MTEIVPKVYMRLGPTVALIGPFHEWQVGDLVDVPARPAGTLDSRDPGSPAFSGFVHRIEADGLARVVPVVEDDIVPS